MLASTVTFLPQFLGALPNEGSLPPARPGVKWRKRNVGAHLVHEHQTLGVDRPGYHQPPGRPQELVALSRSQRSFFRLHPRRLSILETVDSLTETPATRPRYSRRSERVAAGRSSMCASKSLRAVSSVHLGLGAGTLLGGEGASLLGQLDVALDRGAAHPEGAGGLALGSAPAEGFDDLLAQVFGVGVHARHDARWTICAANRSRARWEK